MGRHPVVGTNRRGHLVGSGVRQRSRIRDRRPKKKGRGRDQGRVQDRRDQGREETENDDGKVEVVRVNRDLRNGSLMHTLNHPFVGRLTRRFVAI